MISRKPIIVPRVHKPNINKPYGYVYLTTNLLDNCKYIGQHKSSEFDDKYYGSGDLITEMIKLLGIECFNTEPIDWAENKEELNQKEIWWIDFLGCVESDNWYNIAVGGECGPILYGEDNPVSKPVYKFDLEGKLLKRYVSRADTESDGFIASKISTICNLNDRQSEITYFFRNFVFSSSENYKFSDVFEEVTELDEFGKRHLTEATKKKISEKSKLFRHTESSKAKLREYHLGRKLSEETKAKISKNRKGKLVGEDNPNYGGKTYSEEQRRQHSEFMKGKRMSPKTEFTSENSSGANNSQAKSVVQLTLDNKLVKEYGYVSEVKKYGFDIEAVRRCCKRRQPKHKDYKWMYKIDYEKMLKEAQD